jgi:hypothetical protein
VVALLAVELFEVLALQLLDGLQQLIRSRRWPMRIRALRSHQTVVSNDERELVELVRIWGPLLLVRVAMVPRATTRPSLRLASWLLGAPMFPMWISTPMVVLAAAWATLRRWLPVRAARFSPRPSLRPT